MSGREEGNDQFASDTVPTRHRPDLVRRGVYQHSSTPEEIEAGINLLLTRQLRSIIPKLIFVAVAISVLLIWYLTLGLAGWNPGGS